MLYEKINVSNIKKNMDVSSNLTKKVCSNSAFVFAYVFCLAYVALLHEIAVYIGIYFKYLIPTVFFFNSSNVFFQDFISSLFWILESKRVEWSREGGERSTLLCAPFERKDFVGLDMESRNNRWGGLFLQGKFENDSRLNSGSKRYNKISWQKSYYI